MRVESSVDKNKIGRVVEDETGRLITTYEVFESQYVRKCVCDCKHYREKGMVAECKLFDDRNNLVESLMFPNQIAWHCFSCCLPIGIDRENQYLVFPCTCKGSPACFEIKTNEILWSWSDDHFWHFNIFGGLIYSDWLLTSKGGIKVLDIKTGEILREVMKYNTKMNHPYINRLNEQYLIIYSEGGVFLLDTHTDKIYMSKKIFREFMSQDAEFVNLSNIENDNGYLILKFVNKGYVRVYSTDTLGWDIKEIAVPMNEILDDIKESPLGIKIPTTKAGVERVYKKLFE